MIEHIDILNWRSIRRLRITPRPLCALVGPNNAGKSNILSALDLVFGSRYPSEASFNDEDRCFGDRALQPEICVRWTTAETPTPVDFSFHKGFDDPALTLHKGNASGGWSRGVSREEWRRFSLLRIGTDRRVSQQAPTNRWSLLGRLLQDVDEELNASSERLQDFEDALERLQHDVLQATPSFDVLRTALKRNMAEQLGHGIDDIDVDLALKDPWSFYRLLHLIFVECGMRMRGDQGGAGLQSLLVIGIVRTYAALARGDRAVIAIEEPELFLHPQGVRRLYRLLRELAYPTDGREPLQVFYTTHSASMLDLAHFDEIVRVRKRIGPAGWGTDALQVSVESVIEAQKSRRRDSSEAALRAHLGSWLDDRRSEALFASAALLVEGPTEALCFPIFGRAAGIDLDEMNVAVVPVGGKAALASVRDVLASFEIPCFVVADADGRCRPDQVQRNLELNSVLIRQAGAQFDPFPPTTVSESVALWENDFETMLAEEVPRYRELVRDVASELGTSSKSPAASARCASILASEGRLPPSVLTVLRNVAELSMRDREAPATTD